MSIPIQDFCNKAFPQATNANPLTDCTVYFSAYMICDSFDVKRKRADSSILALICLESLMIVALGIFIVKYKVTQ
jgi:hypothetical protein